MKLTFLGLIIAALMITGSTASFADEFADQMAERLKQQLSLTEDQTNQVKEIAERYKPVQETRGDSKTRMEDMQNEIYAVLNDNQKQNYLELQRSEKKRVGGDWDAMTEAERAQMKP